MCSLLWHMMCGMPCAGSPAATSSAAREGNLALEAERVDAEEDAEPAARPEELGKAGVAAGQPPADVPRCSALAPAAHESDAAAAGAAVGRVAGSAPFVCLDSTTTGELAAGPPALSGGVQHAGAAPSTAWFPCMKCPVHWLMTCLSAGHLSNAPVALTAPSAASAHGGIASSAAPSADQGGVGGGAAHEQRSPASAAAAGPGRQAREHSAAHAEAAHQRLFPASKAPPQPAPSAAPLDSTTLADSPPPGVRSEGPLVAARDAFSMPWAMA